MLGPLIAVILITVSVIILVRGFSNKGSGKREEISPDFVARNLAINSSTGQVWMQGGKAERVVSKTDIQGFVHEWRQRSSVVHTVSDNHHFVFTIRDIKNPRFVVYFDSSREATEWKQRLDVFLNM